MSCILRIAALSAAGLFSTLVHCQSLTDRAQSDELAFMSSEEPAMRQAFAKAKSTLDDFLSLAKSPPSGTHGYALKVAISEGQNTEYFWVNKFAIKGEEFVGTLNNEPRMVKKYKIGERITFRRSQIVDWIYMESATNRMHGNFTACALLSKEPPDEAEKFKKQYGLDCN